jgi:hypothetical protein
MSDFLYLINKSILIKKKLIKFDYNINLIIGKIDNIIKAGNKIFICENRIS